MRGQWRTCYQESRDGHSQLTGTGRRRVEVVSINYNDGHRVAQMEVSRAWVEKNQSARGARPGSGQVWYRDSGVGGGGGGFRRDSGGGRVDGVGKVAVERQVGGKKKEQNRTKWLLTRKASTGQLTNQTHACIGIQAARCSSAGTLARQRAARQRADVPKPPRLCWKVQRAHVNVARFSKK